MTRAKGITPVRLLLWLVVVGLLTGLLWPLFREARSYAQRLECNRNMQLLASAKEEWAKKNNVPDGSHCDTISVLKNVKGGKMPCCPTTGKPMHDIGKVGEDPFCLVHGTMVKTPSPDGTSPGNN